MGNIIVRQPDGQEALYSDKSQIFVLKNTSVNEIRKSLIQRAIARIDSDVVGFYENRKNDIVDNRDPFFDMAKERDVYLFDESSLPAR